MRALRPGLYALLLLLVPVQASALEARMRIELAGEAPYWVGQRIQISVDILSTGFSFSQQRFDLPEIPGVVLLRPGSAGQNLTETIDGESWQGLRYRLSLLVLQPGEVEIPPFSVSFQVAAGYGSEPEGFSFKSEPLTLTVRQPPGTEGLGGLLTTPELRVEGQWEPGSEALKVGDALTLTLRRVAEDVPGAAIPPLELQLPAGLQAYPESPEITDRSNRGSLTGERVERISVILQAPGEYRLPAMDFPWFNPDDEALHEAEIPALEFSVAPDPDAPADGDSGAPTPMETRRSRQALAVAMLVFVLLAVGSWWGLPRAMALWRERRSRWRASEAGRFAALLHACGQRDPRAADRALLVWLASAETNTSTLVAAHPALARPLADLQEALLGRAGWSGRELAAALQACRRSRQRGQRQRPPLPPLNPTTGSFL